MRVPRSLRNTASPAAPEAASTQRHFPRYVASARFAVPRSGTRRSFEPLPITRRTSSSSMTSRTSSPHSSDTRRPQPYSTSSIALSRWNAACGRASRRPLFSARGFGSSSGRNGSSMSANACSCVSTSGRRSGRLGSGRFALGWLRVICSPTMNLWKPLMAEAALWTEDAARPASVSPARWASMSDLVTSSGDAMPRSPRNAMYLFRSLPYDCTVLAELPRSTAR